MPMKGSGATSMEVIDRFDDGVGWLAYPDERMQRASHALAADGEVWLLDPVDADGVDDLVAEFGEVAGVVVLLDRHKRDAGAIARRHDVPVAIPQWMTGVASKLGAPVERVEDALGDTGYELRTVVDSIGWQEAGLYDGETLYVPEALGTVDFFRAPGERLGVHPVLRLTPPRSLRELTVERLLVGHGRGVESDADAAIARAIDGSRRNAPGLYAKAVREFLVG
jgi:hypothetical protein